MAITKMTEKERVAWRIIRAAYLDFYITKTLSPFSGVGLCGAVLQLVEQHKIGEKLAMTMRERIEEERPADKERGHYWWPRTSEYALERVNWVARLLNSYAGPNTPRLADLPTDPSMSPEERAAWQTLHGYFHRYATTGLYCDYSSAGICNAVRYHYTSGHIKYELWETMTDRIRYNAPFQFRSCLFWWSYTQQHAADRAQWITDLLAKYPEQKA